MNSEESWRSICNTIKVSGYEALNSDQRVWVETRAIIDATNNGGVVSYFYNSGADRYYDCLTALERLAVFKVRALLEEAGSLFGKRVSASQDVRNSIISCWNDGDTIDALLDRLDEQLYAEFPALEVRLSEFLAEAGIIV
jgi:hypothetical protein